MVGKNLTRHDNGIHKPSTNLNDDVKNKIKNIVITEKREEQRLEDKTFYKDSGIKYYNLYYELIKEKEKRNEIEINFIDKSISKMIELIKKKVFTIENYNTNEKISNINQKLDNNSFVDFESSLMNVRNKIKLIHEMFINDYRNSIAIFQDCLDNLKFDEDVIETKFWKTIQGKIIELNNSINDERKQLQKEKLEIEETISLLNVKIEKEEIRQLAKKKIIEAQKIELLKELEALSL
uniref:Uncharacterized protein n=1 Tax=Parastrongyloides trichosuri TaxID=131310 RepID=A0A0N4ZNQ0_PARTI